MGRAMVVNAAQLASYSQAKQVILQTGKYRVILEVVTDSLYVENFPTLIWLIFLFLTGYLKDGKNFETFTLYVKDGIFCHFLASMFSGLVTTIASMPVDIAKTRYYIT